MQRTKPPFRADEVGSLLRPARIKEARARFEKGEFSPEELRKIEDSEIEKVVHKQASVGLKLATDGEFRRSWWHFDFLAGLTGCELFHPDVGIQFAGVQTRHDAVRVIGKLDFPDRHPMLDHRRAERAKDTGARRPCRDIGTWRDRPRRDEPGAEGGFGGAGAFSGRGGQIVTMVRRVTSILMVRRRLRRLEP